MVAVRIDDSSQPPAVLVGDRRNDFCARRDGAGECRVGILDDHHHANRPAAQRFGAEVEMLRGFVGQPEFGARHRQPRDHFPGAIINPEQLIGAQRQFVFADAARQRLPELALFASSLLMYLAATHPAQPTGFWDRSPRPTAGRLRRVLAQLDISKTAPLPGQLRKKQSVTGHLPKGIQAHRRSARPIEARV